jgi:hypothetical protein
MRLFSPRFVSELDRFWPYSIHLVSVYNFFDTTNIYECILDLGCFYLRKIIN